MATVKQKKAFENTIENRGNKGKAMIDAGYSKAMAKNPKVLTESKGWNELMEEYLPDKALAKSHKRLLEATRIEHMVFPLKVDDDEIKKLLKSVNCKVKKIQHGDIANHCWFWARDNKAMKDGLDLAYKLKGKYAPEKKEITVNEIDSILDDIHDEKESIAKEKHSDSHGNVDKGGVQKKGKKQRVETEQSILD